MTDTTLRNLVNKNDSIKQALQRLNELSNSPTLFITDDEGILIGTLTDGDVRRAILRGVPTDSTVEQFMNTSFKYLTSDFTFDEFVNLRRLKIRLIPILSSTGRVDRIIDIQEFKSLLPLEAVIMAGGKGQRLMPLTANTPKPLLKVNNKPIIQYNIERLRDFGVKKFYISIGYLGEQLEEYFGNGRDFGVEIEYIRENTPLGTIGAVRLIKEFGKQHLLVMNSDLLTNIDYEDLYREMIIQNGDMIVATTPYEVKVPYGVIDTDGAVIKGLKEKPTYTYYSNAGIYIIHTALLQVIPESQRFDATDMMLRLIEDEKRVLHYPILDYWLDIGKHEDFDRAQKEIKHIKF